MMEDFSGLALPPLFGGHILEAELEAAAVELAPGPAVELAPGPTVELAPGPAEVMDGPGRDSAEERTEVQKRKCQALSKRCKEIEQVNERILGRLYQVQRLLRRMKKERRFLMKTLDSYGDEYRTVQFTIPLEDEGGAILDCVTGGDDDGSSPSVPHQAVGGPKKKRHRVQKEREGDSGRV
ncbi:TCF3 fusion partner isoform X2 [Electrophorus electricus]|nr:TCF3 fusion partner isoform X2 [Electrophorus electricus]